MDCIELDKIPLYSVHRAKTKCNHNGAKTCHIAMDEIWGTIEGLEERGIIKDTADKQAFYGCQHS